MVQIQTNGFPEAGEQGWAEAIKRYCRRGINVLITDYLTGQQRQCRAIEADVRAEDVNVYFWPDGSTAWFIVLPPYIGSKVGDPWRL